MMIPRVIFVVSLVGCLGVTSASAQTLTLRVEQGLVTMSARNVVVSEILARWTQVTGVTVVNGDRATMRVTLELVNEPERSALAVVLRDVHGYILAARQSEGVAGAMTINRILIAPASTEHANTVQANTVQANTGSPTNRRQVATARAVAAAPILSGIAGPPEAGQGQVDADDSPRGFAPATSIGEQLVPVPGAPGWMAASPAVNPDGSPDPSPGVLRAPYVSPDGQPALRLPTQPPVTEDPLPAPGQAPVAPNPFGVTVGGVPGTVAPARRN